MAVLKIELRASHMLSKCFTTELHDIPEFDFFVYVGVGYFAVVLKKGPV